MLKRLIDFVASRAPGHAVKLTLQDMALCRLWAETQARRSPLDAAGDAVSRAVEAWQANPETPDLKTAGRRHQTLLRDLVDFLKVHPVDSMTVEEAAFLNTVVVMCRGLGNHDAVCRTAELLAVHVPKLESRMAGREPAQGLPTLEQRIQYATERDILAAESTHIRLLAGIELPCRGPVFKASGNLRLLGDVPEGCTVVVENDGVCGVDGYVMGRVLSKRRCEVRHNVSGVAIVLTGDIRARGIINNAIVVSKLGSVFCMNAQGPKLVFGGNTIEVEENVLMGRFVSRSMHVGGEVRGSRMEISEDASATHFRHLGMSNVSVVLRRELSCADFGEVTGAELNQLLSRAYGLRRHARNFAHLAMASRREADHSAQSVLMFVFGGGEVQKRLENLLRAQRRHGFISSVVDNLTSMLADAEGPYRPTPNESPELADVMDPEFDGEDVELQAVRAEASRLRESLSAPELDRRQATMLLQAVREKLAEMLSVQAQLAEQVSQEERAVQNVEKYEQILAGGGKGATKLEVLQRILPALSKQPAESAVGKRLRSPFTVRALRTVERAVKHAAVFDQKAMEHSANFRSVSDRLGKDFQIRILENPEAGDKAARVTGRFESGARIYMNNYVENPNVAPADALIITPDDDAVRTYLLSGAGTRFFMADSELNPTYRRASP